MNYSQQNRVQKIEAEAARAAVQLPERVKSYLQGRVDPKNKEEAGQCKALLLDWADKAAQMGAPLGDLVAELPEPFRGAVIKSLRERE